MRQISSVGVLVDGEVDGLAREVPYSPRSRNVSGRGAVDTVGEDQILNEDGDAEQEEGQDIGNGARPEEEEMDLVEQ